MNWLIWSETSVQRPPVCRKTRRWTRAMTERKQNNSKDFSIERILGVDRLKNGPLEEIKRPPDKEADLSASCNSSSCEEDEGHQFRQNIDIDETESSVNFLDSESTAPTSWLNTSYGCPPFFNRGWFSQTIRPPFFTLQGDFFFLFHEWLMRQMV